MAFWETVAANWLGGFLGAATLASLLAFPYLEWRRRRARIRPEFLTMCELGVTAEWIRKKFGEPRYRAGADWVFHFTNAFAVIRFNEHLAVRAVIVALKDWNCRVEIPVWMHDIAPLGEATLADVATSIWKHGPVYEISNESWPRGTAAAVRLYDGPPQAYRLFGFGALWPLTPGCLAETEIEFESNLTIVRKLEGVRINWAGLAESHEDLHLDWGIGLFTQNTGHQPKFWFF